MAPQTATKSTNDAQRLLLRYFDRVLNGKHLEEMDAIFAEDFVYHSAGSPDIRGRAALKAWVADYLKSVPDYHATFEDSFGEGERAMLRWSCTGTHNGPLFGLAATGKKFTLTGISVFRVAHGRAVEGWIERDSLGLFKQLSTKQP